MIFNPGVTQSFQAISLCPRGTELAPFAKSVTVCARRRQVACGQRQEIAKLQETVVKGNRANDYEYSLT